MKGMTAWTVVGLSMALAAPLLAGEAGRARHAAERRQAAGEAARERREEAKDRAGERREEAKDRAGERREEAKEKSEARREEQKEKRDKRRAGLEERAESRVDKRQENQARRIEHGIAKGYLTPDEVKRLSGQQLAIADLEASFTSDGKLTRDEARSLATALNKASRMIFSEKHDAEGDAMPVYRLGENIRLRDEVAQKLASEGMSNDEARTYAKQFRYMLKLKERLASEELADDERANLQDLYNRLLNKYFVISESE